MGDADSKQMHKIQSEMCAGEQGSRAGRGSVGAVAIWHWVDRGSLSGQVTLA